MTKLKFFSALALSLALFVPSVESAQASTLSKLTYTQTGANYMYSNTPENIKDSNSGYEHRFENGKYSYYTLQRYTEPKKEYVGEYYHHNNSGGELHTGYAIYNGSNATRYVTIKNDSMKLGIQDNPRAAASDMEIEYMSDIKVETKAIPAWSSIFIKDQRVPAGKTFTGKVKYFTDGNLTVRHFVSKQKPDKTFPTATEIMDLSKTPQVKVSTSHQTTANYRTDTRKTTVDYNATKSFYVGAISTSEHPQERIGINEYEEPIDYIGTSRILQGNYGILYEFTIKNGAGKQIEVVPDYSRGVASVFVYFDGNKWTKTPQITSGSHKITIPSNGVLKYILPGGTNGIKLFKFTN
ncbi:TPA: hypothetical protein ACGN81_005197 [Bacillus cereus]